MARRRKAVMCVAAACAIGLLANRRVSAQRDVALDEALSRATAYVATVEKELAMAVWTERYTQEDRTPARFPTSGGRFTQVRRRQLTSEMLFVWVDADATWLAVRDVISVDGRPVTRRLPSLLRRKDVALADLRALAAENGRYNLGAVYRSFNEPTLALTFLDMRYRQRFRWSDGGTSAVDGRTVRRVRFREVTTPTVVRRQNRNLFSSGEIRIEEASGRILGTVLEVPDPALGATGRIVVSFGPDEKFAVLVPTRMDERYGTTADAEDGITCTAEYSEYRRFVTGARIVGALVVK